MQLERFDELEALRIAIQSKIDLYSFYKDALQHLQNKSCKDLFATLAEDERKQRHMLEKEYTRVSGKKLLYINLPKQRRFVRTVTPNSSEIDILDTAIQQESEAKDFFERTYRLVKDEDTRTTFSEIVEEEQHHIKLLQSEYAAQQKPEDEESLKLANA
ncbi:hypothetical protein DRQ12_12350 [candidate division KSB1 bacterium]|nr:MAG: hypothetical protein DRQ12_12350 [candidate division KSB1 bacterium]